MSRLRSIIAAIATAAVVTGCGGSSTAASLEFDDSAVVEWELVEIDVLSPGRLSARIVLAGQPGPDEIEATTLAVAQSLRDGEGYSTLRIFVYDRVEYSNNRYTLGRLVDEPADSGARSGDYSSHEPVLDVLDRDWTTAPSAAEAALYAAWESISLDIFDADEIPFEDQDEAAYLAAVEATGVAEPELRDAVETVERWISGS